VVLVYWRSWRITTETRTVYTVRFEEAVYVLHVFQKKSKHGISTPAKELALIERRLALAEQRHGQEEK